MNAIELLEIGESRVFRFLNEENFHITFCLGRYYKLPYVAELTNEITLEGSNLRSKKD